MPELPPAPVLASSSTTPFQEFDRKTWSSLAQTAPLPLTAADVLRIVGLEDPVDLVEVDEIYRPLSALLQLHAASTRDLCRARQDFFNDHTKRPTPYVIGIAGSVAVGKSSTARLLQELLARWPQTPKVSLVTTDGFLYPNSELRRRGIMQRKGFPESYDRRALMRFVSEIKSGAPKVVAPVYSHITYDIVPGEWQVVDQPDILIVEGLNVLQPARKDRAANSLAVSDFFDFSIYVDARPVDIQRWYTDRFLALRKTSFTRDDSYFKNYANLTDVEATEKATDIWHSINLLNLMQNIRPTRSRATLIMRKDANHRVKRIKLRKL